jgi:hypothetical protein
MKSENETEGQPQVGSDAGFVVDGPWSKLADVLQIRHAKTVDEVIKHAEWLVTSYREMCDRLQATVQKHKLGLGGEKIDMLVIEALESALSTNS